MYDQNYIFRLLSIILFVLSVVLSIWFYNQNRNDYINISFIQDSYNFIIVGGGTAGCVLAAKLSEIQNNSVLLIEAGDEFNFLSSVPLLAPLLQGTKYDWQFKSQPQKYSSLGLNNQVQFFPRGKGLGGSNQINYMVHGIDIENELAKWTALGIKNWKYDNLAPYINSLFDIPNSNFNTTESKSELKDYFLQAIKEIAKNIKYVSDQNTINNGIRWTSYHSHLKSALGRDNLHIILKTYVTKVIFDDNKHAIGVEVVNDNFKTIVHCETEIVVSAGAFNSPQILLQSGVGPAHVLRNIRIPVVVDLPGVGKNLYDHLNMPLYVSIEKPISLTLNKVLRFTEFWNYLLYRKGLLSTTPNSGFARKDDIGILLFGMGSTDENILKNIANMKTETFEAMFPFHKNSSQEGFVLLTTCLKPVSRGYISLENSLHKNIISINPQYLSKYMDVECMIRALKLSHEIVNTTAFSNIGARIHWPEFSNCQSSLNKFENDEYFECIIRTGALTGYHPGGTCRMGSLEDRLTVVDENLKVKGTTGLRIMDASILPEPLPTYPNSVLITMAEYAADIVKKSIKN